MLLSPLKRPFTDLTRFCSIYNELIPCAAVNANRSAALFMLTMFLLCCLLLLVAVFLQFLAVDCFKGSGWLKIYSVSTMKSTGTHLSPRTESIYKFSCWTLKGVISSLSSWWFQVTIKITIRIACIESNKWIDLLAWRNRTLYYLWQISRIIWKTTLHRFWDTC